MFTHKQILEIESTQPRQLITWILKRPLKDTDIVQIEKDDKIYKVLIRTKDVENPYFWNPISKYLGWGKPRNPKVIIKPKAKIQ